MPKLADGGVDAVFGIDEDVAGPQPFSDFLPRDEFALARGKQDEQLHRLALDP